MHLSPFLALVVVLSLGGCIMPGPHDHPWTVWSEHTDQETYRLEYTLTNLHSGRRGAAPGDHCGEGWLDEGTMTVQAYAFDRAHPADAYLLIDPTLKGDWSTFGDGPLFRGLPHAVDPAVDQNVTPWTHIERPGPGEIAVDGAAVTLPHHWSYVNDTAGWRVDARLIRGPATILVIEDLMCE